MHCPAGDDAFVSRIFFVLFFFVFFLPAGLPRRGKLPVLFLLTGQKSGFSPRRGDSLHQFRSNFAILTGTWVRLIVQNFTSIAPGGGNAAQKYQKFPLFGKESPAFSGQFRRKDSEANYASIWTPFPPFVRVPDVICNALNILQFRR